MKKLVLGIKIIDPNSSIFGVYNDNGNYHIASIMEERLTRYKHDNIIPKKAKEIIEKELNIEFFHNIEIIVANSFLSHKNKIFYKNMYEIEMFYRKKIFKSNYLKDYLYKKELFKNKSLIGKMLYIFQQLKFNSIYFLYLKFTNKKLDFNDYIKFLFDNYKNIKIKCYDHEKTHAISSFISSKFDKALCITMDGNGDNNSFSSIYKIDNNFQIDLIIENKVKVGKILYKGRNYNVKGRVTIGGIYSHFTYFLGFHPGADEGKVEALAAFGKPIKEIYSFLEDNIKVNGIKIIINEDNIQKELPLLLEKYENEKESLAATIQKFSEEIILKYIKNAVEKTGCKNICLSGGVFANVIINKRIFEEISENIHIVPAMGDDGSSEGACYLAMLEEGMIDELKEIKKNYNMPYFGTSYTKKEVKEILEENKDKIKYKELGDDWYKIVAKMLVEGKIGALFRGKMEWGPRALGNRSIIARVNDPDIQKKMNKEIKRRPEFQPFCPSILIDEKERLFEKSYNNKHMTIAFQMKEEHIKNIPSAVHIDGTARVQFVTKEDNEGYYNLIKEVKNLTGYGVIINTSFNKHGRTIVESPQDAITDFLDTDMDYLFIEGFLVERKM